MPLPALKASLQLHECICSKLCPAVVAAATASAAAQKAGINMVSRKDFTVLAVICLICCLIATSSGYRIGQVSDSYPWTNCNSFEATKKNCPRGEACLKLKNFKTYVPNWAMRCQNREEFIARVDYIFGL